MSSSGSFHEDSHGVAHDMLAITPVMKSGQHNNAMHTELAAVPDSPYNVTRANRVIASVRCQIFIIKHLPGAWTSLHHASMKSECVSLPSSYF